jgi:hypothetical protein
MDCICFGVPVSDKGSKLAPLRRVSELAGLLGCGLFSLIPILYSRENHCSWSPALYIYLMADL